MSIDEQTAKPSDLIAKVTALSDNMKTVLDWIKIQSATQSTMPVEKSGLLLRIPPPKARMTPMRSVAENTSGTWDDDNSDDDVIMALSLPEGRPRPFKVKAKIEISNYDGTFDAKKLDAWLD